MIELHDISQTFGNFHALRGINLSVKEGAVTCVLGDNGAGKSTLIKILAGLNQPTGGTITVDGEEVNFTSPRDSLDAGIATVYQDLALVPSLSVWRNFFLGQELTGALGSLLVGVSPATTRNEQVDQSTSGRPCPLGFPTKSLW